MPAGRSDTGVTAAFLLGKWSELDSSPGWPRCAVEFVAHIALRSLGTRTRPMLVRPTALPDAFDKPTDAFDVRNHFADAFALLQAQLNNDGAGQRDAYEHMTAQERWWATICMAAITTNVLAQACQIANVDQGVFMARLRASIAH